MRKASKGMTLIEVLIIIAVLAIFYWVAAAKVIGMQTEANIARAKGDLKTLRFALDSYIQDNKSCPRKGDYQRILSHEKPSIVFCDLFDPFGKTTHSIYPYEVSANNENYVVYSVGPKRNGKAAIGNDGRMFIKDTAIFETNGFE